MGDAISPLSVTSSDAVTWSVALPTQHIYGPYRFTIGLGLTHLFGIPLNQDQDAINREVHDTYSGSFVLVPVPSAVPVVEGFESGDIATLASWSVARTAGSVVASNTNPEDGTYALVFSSASGWSSYYQDTILHADLAGASGVVLDFWRKEVCGGGQTNDFTVSVSANGTT